MKPNFLSGFLMVLVGALVAFASLFWLPHCGGETPMRCVWLLRACAGVGFIDRHARLKHFHHAVISGQPAEYPLLDLAKVGYDEGVPGTRYKHPA